MSKLNCLFLLNLFYNIEMNNKEQTKKQRKHRSTQQNKQSQQPTTHYDDLSINYANDNINLNITTPNELLLNDFKELKPFMNDTTTSQLSSIHDNSFSDFKEESSNDINNSNYRKQMIARSVLETINTMNQLFPKSERQTSNHYSESNHYSTTSQKQYSTLQARNIVEKYD